MGSRRCWRRYVGLDDADVELIERAEQAVADSDPQLINSGGAKFCRCAGGSRSSKRHGAGAGDHGPWHGQLVANGLAIVTYHRVLSDGRAELDGLVGAGFDERRQIRCVSDNLRPHPQRGGPLRSPGNYNKTASSVWKLTAAQGARTCCQPKLPVSPVFAMKLTCIFPRPTLN